MSHSDLLYKRLDRTQAKKLLAEFLSLYKLGKAFLILTHHFKKRTAERSASLNDAVNIMIAGSINKQGEEDIRTGQYVYNVETKNMEVSFQFIDKSRIRLIALKRRN